MSYRFLEDSATADIAFEAGGATLEELFRAAGDATLNVMIEELDSVRPLEEKNVELKGGELDLLLFDFLQEIIYFKDAQRLLLRPSEVLFASARDGHRLTARLLGEPLDSSRHQQRVDVKAVTLHDFRLERVEGEWRAHVILDI